MSHVNLTVREGDNAVITCNGSGSPLPDVDWIVTGLQSINTHQVGILQPRAARVKNRVSLSYKDGIKGEIVILPLWEDSI